VRALEAEAESLRKLNPILVLGVGYETTDADVRAAFGELTKRYHPDRFVRYQSQKLRQIAAEIFILIRDAYRRLADEKGRQQVLAALGTKAPAKPAPAARSSGGYAAVQPPPAAVVPPRGSAPAAPPRGPGGARSVAVPPVQPPRAPTTNDVPTAHTPYDAPTNPSAASAELAHTELAKAELAIPHEGRPATPARGTPVTTPVGPPPSAVVTDKLSASSAPPPIQAAPASSQRRAVAPTAAPTTTTDGVDTSAAETLIDDGKLDEAIAAYRSLAKKHPTDKGLRAGVELVEGLKALVARDRMEAAQRFESALELDPSNERAARELAEMRRQATNERKGLLSRLMGKKEP
jgi:hypothetical protein